MFPPGSAKCHPLRTTSPKMTATFGLLSKPHDQYISILKKLLVLPTPDKGQVKKSPVVGVHTFNPSTQETEASGSL